MIHIVIGGSLSGKTTFVRESYVDGHVCRIDREMRVPTTHVLPTGVVLVGHYDKEIRTCGVDQMGRDYGVAQMYLLKWLASRGEPPPIIVMEGNALADVGFLSRLDALTKKKKWRVKLTLMLPGPDQVEKRARDNNIQYGRSIIWMSYKRAIGAYHALKKRWEHEVVMR